ncbi:hypothetical protein G6L97_13725 [Agrobacterium tumefaciens]|uniref:plasmid recombination protein n=1 Tax=Agrobacterium tumefaciens TaxID=358 RepID=UPI001572218E|nr:plasmid recombination protein [Agrobacterium tumefaciens]NSZ85225.1 hypothetical protein [Agrobacterium tumefaciens]WCA70476.1 hypothetical protein G6L97_13725 [Agrobacterium tumefaciens]
MAFQFIHMQGYSRKGDGNGRNTSFIFGEARRDPTACHHVEVPRPAVIVYGVDIDRVEAMHDAAAADARTTPKGGKERRVRQDQHTLMTVVASHPLTMDEVAADPAKRAEAELWESMTVDWLRDLYGDGLVSVVRHEDESRWHVHAYILPRDREMKAAGLHPGLVAKAKIMAAGPRDDEDPKVLNKRGDNAYKAAMRGWQDAYFDAVAVRCGLARIGPGLRRLSRQEWQAEKQQAKALQKTLERALEVREEAKSVISTTKADAAMIRESAARAQADADHLLAAAKTATNAALQAQDKALREQRRAKSMMNRVREEGARVREAAAHLQRLPGILRSLWDGFQKSRIQDRLREAVASEVDDLRRAASDAHDRAATADAGRREAETRARNLRQNLTEVGYQLAETRLEIAALRPPESTSALGALSNRR